MDREKVIKGMEICYCPPAKCEDCPYYDLPDEQSCNDTLCLDALAILKEQQEQINKLIEESASNAEMAEGYAELLKEQEKPNGKCVNECECWDSAYERGKQDALKDQEAVKPIYIENPYTHLPVSYCPKCREAIDQYITGNPYRKTKYCHYCGQAVKWNA